MPLMVCVIEPPRPSQKVFCRSFLADPLRFERVLPPVQRLQHVQRAPHQPGISEDTAGSDKAVVSSDHDEGMYDVIWPEFLAPSALRSSAP